MIKLHCLKSRRQNFSAIYGVGRKRNVMSHRNFGLEMVQAKHVSEKNRFYSTNKDKIREERIFEFLRAELICTITASRMGQADVAS